MVTQREFGRVRGKMSLVVRDGFDRDILNITEIGDWLPVFRSQEEAVADSQNMSAEEVKSE